jgi:hypothetical protein
MLITKTNPVGIDFYIQKLQTYMHDILTAKWNVNDLYECYGRALRNKTKNGYKAEVYSPSTDNDHKDVYWNDALAALSFFGIGTTKINMNIAVADVHLVFFVELTKLKPTIAHRADEEVRQDVLSIVKSGMHGFKVTSMSIGVENALKDYPNSISSETLKYADMQPTHCFRINGELTYDINKNC